MPEKDFRSDDAHRSGFVFQVLTMRLLCCADHRRMFSHFTAQIVKIQQIGGTTEKSKNPERLRIRVFCKEVTKKMILQNSNVELNRQEYFISEIFGICRM